MKKAIIVDLDGTAAYGTHHSLWFQENPNYDKINQAVTEDVVQVWCKEIINTFYNNGYELLFVTARDARAKLGTIQWLEKAFPNTKYQLIMRKAFDERPDYIIKKDLYNDFIAQQYDVMFCLEDKQDVTDMWRSLGLVCLHCGITGIRN